MRSYEFYLKPLPGECAHVTIPLPAPSDAVLTGCVRDETGPVAGALVLLLPKDHPGPERCAVTDENGRFWFGPLSSDTLYIVRVQKEELNVREVEM